MILHRTAKCCIVLTCKTRNTVLAIVIYAWDTWLLTPHTESPVSLLLSSSRTSVPLKLGLFNAKIHNENGPYIHRLIHQLNEKDLLGHSR